MQENEKQREQEIVGEVTRDFLRRREMRRFLETKWQLCQNFLAGNQYVDVTPRMTVEDAPKAYEWSFRGVYNNIAPIIESRLARLGSVRPKLVVRAATDEEGDLRSAELASRVLESSSQRIGLSDVIARASVLSETYGTAFYEILWNPQAGKTVGVADGKPVYEGDISVTAVSPFEIFPDSLTAESLSEVRSLIHAKAVPREVIRTLYQKEVEGKTVDAITLTEAETGRGNAQSDSVVLIERYERESEKYPLGRLTVVAGNTLLFDGDLPYVNGESGRRDFPFVRQTALLYAGMFFGLSVVERLIPVQRAYNAVKNRKHEYLNRVANGVLTVEDGSVDTDELMEDGLCPGKVVVYRQGSTPPKFLQAEYIPNDFHEEEERLSNEFIQISGVSEVTRTSKTPANVTSGVALQLLIEQDENRLSMTVDAQRRAILQVGKQMLRLLRAYAGENRLMKSGGTGKKVQMFYFSAADLNSDDVIYETETEQSASPAQTRSMVLELIGAKLLTDDEGKMNASTRRRLLRAMGCANLSAEGDLSELHSCRAGEENVLLTKENVHAEIYDDHNLHVTEHTRYLLSERVNETTKARFVAHIQEHENYMKGGENSGE